MRKIGLVVGGWWLVAINGCSLAPDFQPPHINIPQTFKEAPLPDHQPPTTDHQPNWKEAAALEQSDRGEWWKLFGDEQLNTLEQQAREANASLQAASARVQQARALAETQSFSFLPDLSIGGNAVRAKPASATLSAFGQPERDLKPYTLYSGQGVLSYEADLFSRVRDNYEALRLDADAEQAAYTSTLLALQADVAQNYFQIRALDSERQLLRDTVKVREEGLRIMQRRFDVGEAGEPDLTRSISELASAKADLLSLDRQRSGLGHALAVLLGKMPSDFSFAEAPLLGTPPAIPAGLPSSLLERRPDIAGAQARMKAANARIGVARTAFFPRIALTASGGYQSTELSDLFKWTNHTWALGQLAGDAIAMPIFDSFRNLAGVDLAHATYDEAVANYRQQVLLAFRDVEDNLSGQRYLAAQSAETNIAATATARTTEVIRRRYDAGDIDFFQVVDAQRDSLNAGRAAIQTNGQRFSAAIALIRALGGGWGGEYEFEDEWPSL